MALIKCPECGKEVSSEALGCPHCGYRLKKTTYSSSSVPHYQSRSSRLYEIEHDRKYKGMIAGGIIAIIAAIILLFFIGVPDIKYNGEAFAATIGSIIVCFIGGVILIAVGIHRLNE